MQSAFYTWLTATDSSVAAFLKRNGVSPKSSRLHALLRGCRDSYARHLVKVWHRRWRNLSPTNVYCFESPTMKARSSIGMWFDYDCFSPDNIASFAVEENGKMHDMFPEIFEGAVKGARWNRVIRRWEAKHLPDTRAFLWTAKDVTILRLEHRTIPKWLQTMIEAGKCPTCEGSGTIYETHEPGISEPLGCHDCMGSGKA